VSGRQHVLCPLPCGSAQLLRLSLDLVEDREQGDELGCGLVARGGRNAGRPPETLEQAAAALYVCLLRRS